MKHVVTPIRRIIIASAILVCCALAIITTEALCMQSYDEAFQLLKIGDQVEDVEALLGRPYESVELGSDRRAILLDPKNLIGSTYYPLGDRLEQQQLIERGELIRDH